MVRVADVNDNPPIFEKSVYRMQIAEDEAAGYQLALIRATGGDHGETVTYRIMPDSGIDHYFQLDNTGRSKSIHN